MSAAVPASLYRLDHLAVLSVQGPDSPDFLQGQFTCDINSLTAPATSVAGCCNPKGRVVSTLLVVRTAVDGFLLLLPADLLEVVRLRLQKYVLRARVRLQAADDWTVSGIAPGSGLLPGQAQADGGGWRLGWYAGRELWLAPAATPPVTACRAGDAAVWRGQDVDAGFPWFGLAQTEQYTPQMLNLDGLGGVSFSKGCYTGQEIVARSHFLGSVKRHLYIGRCAPGTPAAAGMAVQRAGAGQALGSVLAAQPGADATRLLLVLQDGDLAGQPLQLDDGRQTAINITGI